MRPRSIRGNALLASVKPGGGGWRAAEDLYRLAAGAIISEAMLERIVLVERARLRPGSVPGEGALERLRREVEAEPRRQKIKNWLEETAPWAQSAIGEELAAAGLARLVSKRFLGVFLPQPQLEILDRPAQDEAHRIVRETMIANHPMHETALLALLAGSIRNPVEMKRGQARRRFRELQAFLPEQVRAVVEAYRKWEIRGPADG